MHDFILTKAVHDSWGGWTPIEQPLIEWARQFWDQDKVALDIGAHVGDWAVNMAGFCKRVYAFEPQQSTYRLLMANCLPYRNLSCSPLALGQTAGPAVLHVNDGTGGGNSAIRMNPTHENVRVEEVVVSTLDALSDEIRDVNFIKLDVEGHEEDVIRGGSKFLEANDWPRIVLEAWSYPWFADRRRSLFCHVQYLGYTLSPVNWPDTFLAERR